MAGGDSDKGVARTNPGNGAFVAIDAAIVAHLEEKRAVAKTIAALDTFGTPDAEPLVNRVFVIGILNVGALDGGGRAQTVFRSGVEIVRLRLEITGAELAIAANGKRMDALDRGLFQDAVGGAIAAAKTFLRINLPNRALGVTPARHQPQ